MDCIEQLSILQLVCSRVYSLFYVTNFLTAIVVGQNSPSGAQLLCFPDEISNLASLLACFESHKEVSLDWVIQRSESSVQWRKYAGSYDPHV